MPKDILIDIINKGLFFQLVLISGANFTVWFVMFKLGFKILNVKIEFRQMLPAILIITLYSLSGKQFLSNLAFGVILVGLIAILLKIIGRSNLLNSLWSSFLVFFIMGVGTIAHSPLFSFDTNIAHFLIETPYGVLIGTLIEGVFPAIMLLTLSTFNIILLPNSNNKVKRFDFVSVLLFGLLFFLTYNFSIKLLLSFQNASKNVLESNLLIEWFATVSSILAFCTIYAHKQREQERLKFEKEKFRLQLLHSDRLIGTLASEHREFRNRLQVMRVCWRKRLKMKT